MAASAAIAAIGRRQFLRRPAGIHLGWVAQPFVDIDLTACALAGSESLEGMRATRSAQAASLRRSAGDTAAPGKQYPADGQ
ncbi:MAG: hypothetical protein D6753_01670 [Planctomycetota bacterium]|nr:MAG: hypothetical protein D6753_01670 [Planctomycetota bacterium]